MAKSFTRADSRRRRRSLAGSRGDDTLFWLTTTGVSAARLYWENKPPFFTPKGVKIPVAVSAFPDELFQAPKSWAEQAYPKPIHYNKLDKGGSAWEQPVLVRSELRTAFRSMR
jgi:hypothetical protein